MAKRHGAATARQVRAGHAPAVPVTRPRPVKGAGGADRRDDATAELDRLIHERVRLGIVSALAVNQSLSFNALKQLMGVTDGNLSVHARKLEEAGYVSCRKSFAGRVPRTDYELTAPGRRALERYLEHMEAIIRATREGTARS